MVWVSFADPAAAGTGGTGRHRTAPDGTGRHRAAPGGTAPGGTGRHRAARPARPARPAPGGTGRHRAARPAWPPDQLHILPRNLSNVTDVATYFMLPTGLFVNLLSRRLGVRGQS